jgi:hypothetical protein
MNKLFSIVVVLMFFSCANRELQRTIPDTVLSMECNNGIYSDVDLGILKYHFEVGAGRDNFVWE